MTDGASIRPTYSSGRFFLIALMFVGAAPLFWQRVEVKPGEMTDAPENADLYQYVYPALEYGFGRLRAGELPLWNPQQLCGTSFLADPQTALFQPLNAVFLAMPTGRAMAVHAFLSLALMGAFFVLFARSLGLGYIPALIGGLAYAFGGASAAAMSRPALAAALAWSPLVFWAVSEFCRRGKPSGAILAGLAFALLILSGAGALVLAMGLLLAAYAAVAIAGLEKASNLEKARRAAGLVAALLLALAVSAVQWAPALAWLANGGVLRAGAWNFHAAAQTPTNLRELLLQLPATQPGNLPRLAYFGIAALLLVPAAFAHKPLRRTALLLGAAAVVAFGMTLVKPGALPVSFPPQSFAYPGAFAAAVLAAIGADRLFTVRREGVSPGPWAAAIVVLVGAVALFLLFPSHVRGYAIATVAVVIPFLMIRRGWAAAFSGVLVAFLLFIDLVSASANSYTHPFQDAPQCYARHGGAIRVAGEQALGGRALMSALPSSSKLPANLGMITGLRFVGGQDLPMTAAQRAWFERALPPAVPAEGAPAPALNLLNFASARVIVAAAGGPLSGELPPHAGLLLRPIPSGNELKLFVNENALPRAYWVPQCRLADGPEAVLDLLADPAFERDRLCVVDAKAAGPGVAATLPVAAEGAAPAGPTRRDATCTIEDVSPERVKVVVTAPQDGLTVLTDTFAPGWEAELDGVPCRILHANGPFRAVATPAGRHEIVFRYRALDVELAGALSLATLAVVAALGGAGLHRRSGANVR